MSERFNILRRFGLHLHDGVSTHFSHKKVSYHAWYVLRQIASGAQFIDAAPSVEDGTDHWSFQGKWNSELFRISGRILLVKIAYDYQIFTNQKFGGVSRYFFELANYFTRFGGGVLDCRVNAPVYVNDYLNHSRSELLVSGVSAPAIPLIGRIYREISRFMSPIAFRRWQPDIVHETYYSSKSIAPSGSKIIVTVYDMIHELYPEYFSNRDRTREHKRIAVERADHIICISENTRKDLTRLLDVDPVKTTVVHLGFALTQSDQTTLPLRNRPFILYVGSRGGYKNYKR